MESLVEFLKRKKEYRSYNHLEYRTRFIKALTKEGCVLKPIIDVPCSKITESDDMRVILGKGHFNFSNVMKSLGCKVMYVKSGSTGHTFKGFVCFGSSVTDYNVAIKVVAYPKKEKYGSVHDKKRPENAELVMLRVLSDLVLENKTPHLILPIASFTTSVKTFLALSDLNVVVHPRFVEFVEKYKAGELHSTLSVVISEWANGGDLLDYIRKNLDTMKLLEWKVIFFQLVSTLAVIQSRFPGFRHNDLKANNILVHRTERHRGNQYTYELFGKTFRVPNIGTQIKIWDFDFACIPGLVENSKVDARWTNRINVSPEPNRYYDLHFFFNTLTKKGFCPDITSSPYPELKEFIREVVPRELESGPKVSSKGRLLENIEHTTPECLLDNPFFACFL